MFTDDIVLRSKECGDIQVDLERLRFAMEQDGMKDSKSKAEYLCINEMEGDNRESMGGKLKGSDRVCTDSKGGHMAGIKRRIKAGWHGWREATEALTDRSMQASVNGHGY